MEVKKVKTNYNKTKPKKTTTFLSNSKRVKTIRTFK